TGQLLWRCITPGVALVYVPISQNVPAFLRDALFVLCSRALLRPVVLHLHGGYFRHVYDQEGGAFFQVAATAALNAAGAVIVLADEFRAVFKGLVPDERVFVVENGVPDPGAWQLRIEPEAGSQRLETILFMSALTRTKGILELIKAIGLLRQSRPQVRLKVAGAWREEALRAEVENLIEHDKLGPYISFVGEVSGAGKAPFLAGGDVFCLPTRYPYEGQPLVILEAMASGLPVLATQHGAIGSTVADGITGKLVSKDATPELLAQALNAMLADRTALRQYGEKARERYLARYTLGACHQRLFEVFERVAGG
ncbi:MAG: glycosyltransferase family 4 protein, partial [Planctomycetota bacterium]